MGRNAWCLLVVSILALTACDGGEEERARGVNTTTSSRPVTASTSSAPSNCLSPRQVEDDEGTTTVFVYFFCERTVFAEGHPRAEHLFALPRRIPRTETVLRAALEELVKGTTVEEHRGGFQSFFFGADTADLLVAATVTDDGVAIVDFSKRFADIGNVSTAFTATAHPPRRRSDRPAVPKREGRLLPAGGRPDGLVQSHRANRLP